jgi:hypothetical protein
MCWVWFLLSNLGLFSIIVTIYKLQTIWERLSTFVEKVNVDRNQMSTFVMRRKWCLRAKCIIWDFNKMFTKWRAVHLMLKGEQHIHPRNNIGACMAHALRPLGRCVDSHTLKLQEVLHDFLKTSKRSCLLGVSWWIFLLSLNLILPPIGATYKISWTNISNFWWISWLIVLQQRTWMTSNRCKNYLG